LHPPQLGDLECELLDFQGTQLDGVRRQSIASISSANCADVNVNVPSTIGGQTNLLRSSRLANRHRPLPSQYSPFR
jgi:hypothetical protein